MATVALKGRTFTESSKKASLKDRIAEGVAAYFEKYGVEVVCGLAALSGNTNGAVIYQMLRK